MNASRTILAALVLVAAPFYAACDLADSAPDTSLVVASVHVVTPESEFEDDYTGSGFFGTAIKNRHLPTREWVFAIHSVGRGDSQGMSLTFYGPERNRPANGTYSIGDGEGEFLAGFLQPSGGTFDWFRAGEGEIEITSSSKDRIEGTFRLVGSLAGECGVHSNGMWCHTSKMDSSVTAEVSGHFEAIPRQINQWIPQL